MGNRSASIRVRVTEAEREAVRERAAAFGCSASAYVRHAVAAYALASDAAGGGPPALVGVETSTMLSIDRELLRQGANLNQVAHALNTAALAAGKDGPLSEGDRRVLLSGVEEARLELPAIRRALGEVQAACDEAALKAAVAIPRRRRRARPAGGAEGASPCP